MFAVSVFALSAFSVSAAWAKSARIRQPIDEASRVALRGNTRPLPKGAVDLGPANASLPSGRMLLVLKRSAAEDAELQQLLSDLQDKNSASYHKWLTPAQYAERFGVSAADAQTLSVWLQSHGFTVNRASAGRTSIEFSGTVGQIQSAFHTTIHRYAVGGEEHLANTNDPAIPAALAPVVTGVIGMNDFFPKSAQPSAPRASYDKRTHAAKPDSTTDAGGNLLYVGPADAATIYDAPNAFNANFKGAQPYTGSGVAIAVVGDANINVGDVANYRSFFRLPANTPQVIVDGNDPGVDANTAGDTQKALRDVEIAGALAPNAKVTLYTAADTTLVSGLFLALSRAVDDNLSDIIEFGFSGCEADLGYAGNHFIEIEWQQAAVDGVTVVAAAGDSGSAGCDLPANDSSAANGLAVNGYASTPYNVAVGGTDFDALPGKSGSYVGANGTALGYIPELPWNNSVAIGGNGLLSANQPYTGPNGDTNDFAGGGGASSCGSYASPTSSCAPYSKPSWQSGAANLNIPSGNFRYLPDISLLAGTGQYGATWAVCGNDYDAAGNPIADCAPGSGDSATIQGLGGTSAAASAFAGILALVAQSQNGRLGQANYVLYNLANQASLYKSVFHDIATGNNSVVCAAGGPNCGTNGFLTGYNAAAGYDQASGLGSVDAGQLISNWSKAAFLPTTTTLAVTLANGAPITASVPHGTPIAIQVNVTGSGGGIPTGNVGVLAAADQGVGSVLYGYDAGPDGALNNGSFQATVADEPGGTYSNVAVYGGDLNFAASASSPVAFTVTPEPSEIYMSLYYRDAGGTQKSTASAPAFPYGTYVSVDAEPQRVAPLQFEGVATGTVAFSDNGSAVPSNHADNLNRQGFAEIPNYYWALGQHSIGASYSGDNSFNPSVSGSPLAFAITQSPTTVKVAAAPSSAIGGTVAVTVTVAGSGTGGVAPSGAIALADATDSFAFGSGTLVAGSCTFTIQASQLALGANTLAATYAGDANYIGSSGTGTVTRLAIVGTALAMTATPASLSSGNTTIAGVVTPASSAAGAAPTGSVTLVDSADGAPLGTAPLVPGTANGLPIATFALTVNSTSLALGSNAIAATYAGDPNYSGSTGTTTVKRLAIVGTALTMTANPASLSTGSTTIAGQVTPASSAAGSAPTGSVTLVDSTNGAQLGTAQLVAGTSQNGIIPATFALAVNSTSLAAGANTIVATYLGDANDSGSSGAVVVALVAPPSAAFTITATNATIVNIATPGQTTGNTSTITVTPENGFTGQVDLAVSLMSSPLGADPRSLPTVTLSPSSSVTITGTAPATATATIATTALTYAMRRPGDRIPGRWFEGGGIALAGLLLLGLPARRRGWRSMLGLLLFVGVGLSVGCGVSLNAVDTYATSPGTYVFSVTGVDQTNGLLKAQTTITVTVR